MAQLLAAPLGMQVVAQLVAPFGMHVLAQLVGPQLDLPVLSPQPGLTQTVEAQLTLLLPTMQPLVSPHPGFVVQVSEESQTLVELQTAAPVSAQEAPHMVVFEAILQPLIETAATSSNDA